MSSKVNDVPDVVPNLKSHVPVGTDRQPNVRHQDSNHKLEKHRKGETLVYAPRRVELYQHVK